MTTPQLRSQPEIGQTDGVGEGHRARATTGHDCRAGPVAAMSLRVLLAEDNPVNQRIAQLMLARLGHTVDTVSNGLEAAQAVGETVYDVVLMDMRMPLLDGLGATEQIRAGLPVHRQPRVVAVSTSVLVEDRLASTRAGMDAFLPTPLRLRELDVVLTATASASVATSNDKIDDPGTATARADSIMKRLVEISGPDLSEDLLLFAELLRSVAARAPLMLDDIETAVTRSDLDAVAFDAHSLRGSVDNLGATELAGQLNDIERQARQGVDPEQHAIGRARDELGRVRTSFLAVADDLERQARTPSPTET